VFAGHGGYGGAHAFIQGFTPAVWVAVGLSTLGIIAATLTGTRRQAQPEPRGIETQPALAAQPQAA
jgi:hypothetical protein